jgi:methionine synthase II (cobalamin-independent)
MPAPSSSATLVPALATGIGSLPHDDPKVAAELVLRMHPRLPAAPQLPSRTPLEQMVAQWARALPEVRVRDDGRIALIEHAQLDPPEPVFDDDAHGGLLTFLDVAAAAPAPLDRVKVQITGPLTMGIALQAAGHPTALAFRRAAEVARAWANAVEDLVAERLPGTGLVLFFDEPSLVAWGRRDDPVDSPPLEREDAVDILSGALAAVSCVTGVHVCGTGDRRLVLEAGPDILGVEVDASLVDDADVLARHLDADGWIAWGAVPTDRPVGESSEPLWRALARVWCELTRRGCDPVRIRTQSLLTPACGLAGHGVSQAERAMRLAEELADRVHHQAVAARLTLGA